MNIVKTQYFVSQLKKGKTQYFVLIDSCAHSSEFQNWPQLPESENL